MRCQKNGSKKGGILRPPGEQQGQKMQILGSLLRPKIDSKSPKADLKIIKKRIGFYNISELGRVQGAAWEASKNGSKNGGGCESSGWQF